MQPNINQYGCSSRTGKSLFALWLVCSNKRCHSYQADVPTSYLVAVNVSESDAIQWKQNCPPERKV